MRDLRSTLRRLSSHRFGDLPYMLMALVVPFGAYLHTLAPSVANIFSDSLEMQLVAYRLGIAHPTGYPLYTLLGKAFTLLPVGNVAYRVNLLSAFFGALTIMMVFLAIRCLDARRLASLAAALALAFSPTFWSQAVIAEVYTLNAFFLAGMLWLVLRVPPEGARASSQTSGRFLYPVAFFYGLSLTHHRTMLLLGPALIAYLWFWHRTFLVPEGRVRRLFRCLALFLLPSLLYLYIPIRGMSTTSLDGTYQNTLSGFLSWIMGSSYAVFLRSNPLQQEPRSGEWLAHLFLKEFTVVGVGAGIVGFLCLLRRQLPRAIFLALALLGYMAFGFYYRVSDVDVFFIPAYVIFALAIGYGFSVLGELPARLGFRRIGLPRGEASGGSQGIFTASLLSVLADGLRWLVSVALLLVILSLPVYLLQDNLPRQDMSRDWTAHEYGQRVLQQPLEQGAAIVGILGETTLLRYFQETEGIRADLITIAADEEGERLKAVSQALQAGRAVYLTRPLHGVENSYALASFGPLIKVLPAPLTQVPIIQMPRTVNFGGEITLLGYALEERPGGLQPVSRAATTRRGRNLEREGEGVEAGKHLGVTLYWQAIKKPSQDYKASLRIVSAAGRLVAQRDGTPVADAYRTGAWRQGEVVIDTHYIHVPLGTIPGEYHLQLVLYSEAMPHGVPAYDGRDTSNLVDLGPVRVSRPLNPPSLDALPARSDRPANRPSLPSWTEGDSLASLGVSSVLRGNFANQVSLFGYGLSREPLKPGEEVDIVLLWEAQREMSDDHVVSIRLVDAHGRIWAASNQMPGDGRYPTSRWLRSEIVRDVHTLRLPPDMPDGRYLLQLSLYTPPGNEPVTVLHWTRRSGDTLDLGTVTVKGREHRFDRPVIPRPQMARLGDSVQLLGYGLEREGPSIKLTIYWQALARVEHSYTVFTHLVDRDGRIWAQHDSLPQGGAAPTTGWLPGEVLADQHTLTLKPGAPAGEYRLVIGLYDATSGQRLPVFDATNRPAGDYILLSDRLNLP